jgi:VPDSG-CTERM motif
VAPQAVPDVGSTLGLLVLGLGGLGFMRRAS